jgi:hypothetical protein
VDFEDSLITAFLEASATAVGVGMVLGGFAAGLLGVLRRTPRDVFELRVLKVGYLFAAVCLLVRLGDLGGII